MLEAANAVFIYMKLSEHNYVHNNVGIGQWLCVIYIQVETYCCTLIPSSHNILPINCENSVLKRQCSAKRNY